MDSLNIVANDVAPSRRATLKYAIESVEGHRAQIHNSESVEIHRRFSRSKIAAYEGRWAVYDEITDRFAQDYKNGEIPGEEERTQVEIIMLMGQRFGTFAEMQRTDQRPISNMNFVLDDISRPADECVLECGKSSGVYQIRSSNEFYTNNHAEFYLRRLLCMRPFFELISERSEGVPVHFPISFSDFGRAGALSFSGTDPSFILVPDPIFVLWKAYERHRVHFASNEVRWEEKQPIVFWRGSTTGMVRELKRLPRFLLCAHSETSQFKDMMDVRISGLVQRGEQDYAEIRRRGFLGEHVPDVSLNRYKYHIDIDGNTNSWPGLFIKLLSVGVIFKIASPTGSRQWYYDRLKPWEHYVPVASDFSDLDTQIEWALAHDEEAKNIAGNAFRLANSMTLPSELETACASCLERFATK